MDSAASSGYGRGGYLLDGAPAVRATIMPDGQGTHAPAPGPNVARNLFVRVSVDRLHKFGAGEMGKMAALIIGDADAPEHAAPRGVLLRFLDTLAAWQIRHSYCLIRGRQARSATSTGVNQPSSTNERSSISACDR
jgi:hypothetical protein